MQTQPYPTMYHRHEFVSSEQATVRIASAPVLYGLSIYTVFPVLWNDKQQALYAFRLPDHFRRLQNSARIMGFHNFLDEWTYDKFAAVMRELMTRNEIQEDSLVRVTVYVDEILSGTRTMGLRHTLSAFIYPAGRLLPKRGAHLCVSSWRRTPDNAIPSRAKINGSYVNAALMKQEALSNGYDDAIALDGQGHVAESTVANICLIRGGKLLTPSGSTDLLEGITRDSMFALAESLGVSAEERSIDRSELYLADEAFLCGSSMRITPILSIDRRPIGTGTVGPLTRHFMRLYEASARGTTSKFAAWRTDMTARNSAVIAG